MDRALGRRGHLPLRPRPPRARRSSPSTRRRPPCRGRCTSATSSATPTPTSSRATGACAARRSSTPWAGTTTAWPTERRVENFFGVRGDADLAYDPSSSSRPTSPAQGEGRDLAQELRRALPAPHGARRGVLQARLSARLGSSIDWTMEYTTVSAQAPGDQPARVPPDARARRGLLHRRAHALGRRLPHRGLPGRAGRQGAPRPLPPRALRPSRRRGTVRSRPRGPSCSRAASRSSRTPTTRATPTLFGTTASSRRSSASAVPVLAHELADPDKGTGIAMICTFGDITDVTWWRELEPPDARADRPRRAVPARRPSASATSPRDDPAAANALYAAARGQDRQPGARGGRRRAARQRRPDRRARRRSPTRSSSTRRASGPLEIVTSRQWFVRHARAPRRAARARRGAGLAPRLHAPPLPLVGRGAQRRLVDLAPALLRRALPRLVPGRRRGPRRLRRADRWPTRRRLPVDPSSGRPRRATTSPSAASPAASSATPT